jgi:hypothetical protein
MSFIESLLVPDKRIVVPCQTDSEYSELSSNQCSWCAAEFAKHYDKLIPAFFAKGTAFLDLYKECLLRASINRKTYKGPVYGENIDNKKLKTVMDLKVYLECTYINDDSKRDEFMELLPAELKTEFYDNIYARVSNFEFLKSYKFALISRHGQSLCLLPIGDLFLVLDSHVRTVGLMTFENVVKYVTFQQSESMGYTIVTCLCGA